MKVSGAVVLEMVLEYKFGQIQQNIQESGLWVMLVAQASSYMQMAMCMRVNGDKIKQMEKVSICMKTESIMMGNGRMICKMEWGKNFGMMETNSKENMNQE